MALSSSQPRLFFTIIFGALLASGCGSGEPVAQHDDAAPSVSPTAVAQSQAPQPPQSTATPKEAEEIEEFVPPFPNRTDPFAQPTANKVAKVVRERREQNGADLQLKGFVHVDRPKAMLQMDGQLWIAAAGESRNGVEIAAIAPPVVTLRHDSQDFELSLLGEN